MLKLCNLKLDGNTVDIHLEGKQIISIVPHVSAEAGMDCSGLTAIPGMVDLHVHGCGGHDTMEGDQTIISRTLAACGTTSYLPTTMTMAKMDICRALQADTHVSGAEILGFHMEGPYISPQYKGVQNAEYIQRPDKDWFATLSNVRMVTMAPELEGGLDFIRNSNAVVSLGHTACDYETALAAIDAGAVCLTHTFNAMSPFHHREPGPIGAALERNIYVQVICDGFHLHKTAVLMLYRAFGPDRMILISDGLSPTEAADGNYLFGGTPICASRGKARALDGTIAGSTRPLLDCVRQACAFGIPFADAVRMATLTPATLIGVERKKGRIAPGYDADILLINENFDLKHVICRGKLL